MRIKPLYQFPVPLGLKEVKEMLHQESRAGKEAAMKIVIGTNVSLQLWDAFGAKLQQFKQQAAGGRAEGAAPAAADDTARNGVSAHTPAATGTAADMAAGPPVAPAADPTAVVQPQHAPGPNSSNNGVDAAAAATTPAAAGR